MASAQQALHVQPRPLRKRDLEKEINVDKRLQAEDDGGKHGNKVELNEQWSMAHQKRNQNRFQCKMTEPITAKFDFLVSVSTV